MKLELNVQSSWGLNGGALSTSAPQMIELNVPLLLGFKLFSIVRSNAERRGRAQGCGYVGVK